MWSNSPVVEMGTAVFCNHSMGSLGFPGLLVVSSLKPRLNRQNVLSRLFRYSCCHGVPKWIQWHLCSVHEMSWGEKYIDEDKLYDSPCVYHSSVTVILTLGIHSVDSFLYSVWLRLSRWATPPGTSRHLPTPQGSTGFSGESQLLSAGTGFLFSLLFLPVNSACLFQSKHPHTVCTCWVTILCNQSLQLLVGSFSLTSPLFFTRCFFPSASFFCAFFCHLSLTLCLPSITLTSHLSLPASRLWQIDIETETHPLSPSVASSSWLITLHSLP